MANLIPPLSLSSPLLISAAWPGLAFRLNCSTISLNALGFVAVSNSEHTKAKYEHLEDRLKFVESNMEDCYNLEKRCDDLEDKNEYLENMSRRNNVKIIGLNADTGNEKTWEDTEELVITTIKKKLDIEGVKIERAHCVGKPRPSHRTNPDGSTTKVPPHPIIARLSSWKQKEAILKAAREVKPKEI